MKAIFAFLKTHWIWILAVFTTASIIYVHWYLHNVASLSSITNGTKGFISKSKEMDGPYSRGYQVGVLLSVLVKVKLLIPAILGFTILFGEFKYRTIFKHLFIAGGGFGKFFYFIVSILMWVFLFFLIRLYLPSADQITSADINMAWIIVVGAFIYCVGKYGNESYKQLRELNYEKTKAELMALKAQINPHFLFNILNNLYGTAIVEDSPKTADGIQQLSRIMRHVVEETKTKRSPVEKEIAFLNDYINLQKMRIPERPNIQISTKIEWDNKPYQIAPLLFIPYIENAFKYGISVNDPCFIDMKVEISNGQLNFEIKNSVIKRIDKLEEGTGTGLDNTAKRLALYYPGRHSLVVNEFENIFKVKATVKIA